MKLTEKLLKERRHCYYVDDLTNARGKYFIRLVVENVPGYFPMPFEADTLPQLIAHVEDHNEVVGLTKAGVDRIVGSSMRAPARRKGRRACSARR